MIEFIDKITRFYDPYGLTVYDGMTLARHHAFSAYNYAIKQNANALKGADKALMYQYTGDRIDSNSYMGIDIELRFYFRFKEKLQLVPALDCGDHTDFVGFSKGKRLLIDVTTNLGAKDSADYTEESVIAVYRCDSTDETWSFYSRSGTGFKAIKEPE